MEYRREPRFETNQAVIVTNLDCRSCFQGHLVNFSSQGVRLLLSQELGPGTAVKVQWPGTLLLGEVVYCRPGEGGYFAGLQLEDALFDTEALAAMTGERPAHMSGTAAG
jgi:hypothetical protein